MRRYTCIELFPEFEGSRKQTSSQVVVQGDSSDALRRQIKELEEKLKGMDEMRRNYKQALRDLEEANKLLAQEKARADAERERADAEKARADQALRDLQKLRDEMAKGQKTGDGVSKQQAEMLGSKVATATAEIA